MSRHDPELIRQGIAEGRKVTEIAEDLGVSRASVYRAADKADLPVRRGRVSYRGSMRNAVQGMKPMDALEHVLGAYEDLSGQIDQPPADVGGVYLTPDQSLIFALMVRHLGSLITHDAMLSVLDLCQDREVQKPKNVLAVQISQMRAKLAGQYDIKTVWGRGYMMEAA